MRLAGWGRLVESGLKAQASDEKAMGFLRDRQRSKSFKEAYPPSATATISPSGYQRLTISSSCQAHSVMGLWRLPCSVA
jgi:hypothetical protein